MKSLLLQFVRSGSRASVMTALAAGLVLMGGCAGYQAFREGNAKIAEGQTHHENGRFSPEWTI